MTTAKQLDKYEGQVASAEAHGVLARWKWGRDVLADPRLVNLAGSLWRGRRIAEGLIEAAEAKGRSLSEREIQRRLQFARAYETEAQALAAVAVYGSWEGLHRAGFPPVMAPDEGLDPEPEQGSLDEYLPGAFNFDGLLRPRAMTPLRVVVAYAGDRKRKTAAARRRDRFVDEQLAELIEAAGGDLDVTYGEAQARRMAKGA
jgi:hypothetical protein